jgi:hypothetical protein
MNRQTNRAWIVLIVLCALLTSAVVWQSETEGASDVLLVTSSLGANSAVLFVVDPQSRRMVAYEATPGPDGGVRLLGARKIEHDLLLSRYRDQSELTLDQLRERYESEDGPVEDGR